MSDVAAFLGAIHPGAAPWTVCAFGGGAPAVTIVRSVAEALAEAARLDARERYEGVYYLLPDLARAPVKGRGVEADALACRCAWADVDALDFAPLSDHVRDAVARGCEKKRAKQDAWAGATDAEREASRAAALEAVTSRVRAGELPAPSARVDSGRGWHLYWFLAEPATGDGLRELKGVNRAISILVQGDSTIDLARVLKIPGTHNRKEAGRPIQSVLASCDVGRRYALAELAAMVHATPEALVGDAARKGHGTRDLPLRIVAGVPTAWMIYMARSQSAAASWNGCNVRLKDQGRSGYAMSLASLAVRGAKVADRADVIAIIAAAPATAAWAAEKPRQAEITAEKAIAVGPGVERPTKSRTAERAIEEGEDREPGEDRPAALHCSDLGNARRLVIAHGEDLRYCQGWGRWLVWSGVCWREDVSGEVARRAKATVSAIYAEAARAGPSERIEIAEHAIKSESSRALSAMVTVAESEIEVSSRVDQWDRDPWALAVANGTIDLRTGDLGPHRRDLLSTRASEASHDPQAQCPLWESFVDRIMMGNVALIDFLQRAAGYSLTGSVREQVFFVLHGTGKNGKSTLLEVLRHVTGTYSTNAEFETFLAGRGTDAGSARPDVARLCGARFVTAVEADEGRRLNESVVKQLTGGDLMTARRLYADPFDFAPQFKLWLAANNKPTVRADDEAMWRRIRLIPFSHVVPQADRDVDLAAKLCRERDGILAWMVRGAVRWHAIGLSEPTEVLEATETYRHEMDKIGEFVSDRCVEQPEARVRASQLYEAYREWTKHRGEFPLSLIRFARTLKKKDAISEIEDGYKRKWYVGIGLETAAEDRTNRTN